MPDYPHGYSMPCSFPQYPPPPYTIGRVVGMNFIGVTTDEIARSLVPSPLVPNGRQQLWIYSVDMTIIQPLEVRYHEIGLVMPVNGELGEGLFSVALFLDKSLPVTIGREIWGFPKRIADHIELTAAEECHTTRLAHEGQVWLEGSFQQTEQSTRVPGGATKRLVTHRVMPSGERQRPALSQLIGLDWNLQEEIRWAAADAQLTLQFPGDSRLSALNDMTIAKAWYSESAGCVLAPGEVLRDYLVE